MHDKVLSFPNEAQDCLKDKFGIPKYSLRHLKRRIKAGLYPAPHYITPQRPVQFQSELDEHAEITLARISGNI
jgi:hypothetical protein